MTSAVMKTTDLHWTLPAMIGIAHLASPTVADTSSMDLTSKPIWEETRGTRCISQSKRSSATTTAKLFGSDKAAPTVGETDAANQTQTSSNNEDRDKLLASLRDLQKHYVDVAAEIEDVPKSEAIDDAIVVVQVWPDEIPVPTLDFDDEGQIVLDILDEGGFACAGIDFLGNKNVAVYSIMNGTRVVHSGRLNTASTTEVIQFFGRLISELA